MSVPSPAHRRQACLHELQRLQVEGAGPAAAPGMASLQLTHLAVPLKRDYVRQLNAGTVHLYTEFHTVLVAFIKCIICL